MSGQSGFRHEALIYDDADEFLAATMPFLSAALEAGEPALVAVRQNRRELLEGELGVDAGRVEFADMETLGRNPARIIPFWREFVDRQGDGSVRGIGEPVWPGREPAEIDECQRHESLLNVAFSGSQRWSLLCPYDGAALEDEVLAGVAASHHMVEHERITKQSASYVEEPECFAGALPRHPAGSRGFEFDRTGLFHVRQRVAWAAKSAGLPESETTDLVIAASELATNSIVHGGGSGTLYVWEEDDRLLVEIEDRGSIEQPLVGRVRPEPTQIGNRGLWLANQLCDLVQIRSRPGRTTVRLRKAFG